jgi:hypothetical protein
MRKTLTRSKNFKPPLNGLPPWAVIYGTHEIVIGYAECEGDAQRAADALNRQAPQYRHRVKELSGG